VTCEFLQQNLNVKSFLCSRLLYVVFFYSILLASSATLQQCIELAMFFARWKCDHGLRYELWTLCINTLGHYNLASRLMLHNLQHNTYHLLPILLFRLLNFKVCINNLYSSTTNGCPKAGSSCVLFAHFWWFRWNLESWANWKAQLFQQCFLFSLPHLCHCILLMIIVKI